MLLALTSVSSLQVFMLLGILQATLPVSVTGAIYTSSSSDASPCYEEVDMNGHLPDYCDPTKQHERNCTLIDCPAQGPFSIARSFRLHPLLWTNGLINIAYYVGEVLLYGEPLGVVLIVMAALASSFVIQPLESAMGMVDASTPIGIVFLGLIGSIACVIERKATPAEQLQSFAVLYERFWNAIKRRICCCCGVVSDDDTKADGTGSGSSSGGSSSTDVTRLLHPSASHHQHSASNDKTIRLVPQSPDHKNIIPTSADGAAAASAGGAEVTVLPVNHGEKEVNAAVTGDFWSMVKTTLKIGLPFLILAITCTSLFRSCVVLVCVVGRTDCVMMYVCLKQRGLWVQIPCGSSLKSCSITNFERTHSVTLRSIKR